MVRIAVSLVVLVALVQFLVSAVRVLSVPMESTSDGKRPRQAGFAAGLAVVLLAVLTGMVAQHASDPAADKVAASAVQASVHTTTVAVTATGMRYEPNHIMVPTGDRLVIRLTNADSRKHDLVLATGPRTGLLGAGETAELDAGVIGGTVQGWCSQPMHRQSGMTLTIMGTGQSTDSTVDKVDAMRDPGPTFTARDATLPPAEPGPVHRITLHAREVKADIAAGVNRTLWTFGGTAPGPVLRGRVGDVFEVTLVNDASVEHGIDFHAEALAPDTAMRTVEPGQSVVYRFTATKAGIWMYHCSAMPMLPHIANGMYGAVVIDPPDLAPVDREYLLVQSEFYPVDGPYDTPDAMAFNGFVSQYAFRPLAARTGERVRIWVLDAGPNRPSAFHLVGAPFDTVYLEGSYRLRPTDAGGAQVLDLAPASGGFVEAVLPQPGTYPFLTHAMSDADLGARGAIRAAP
jgi:nitrite reductase (NO-forming)